jgi:cytoskeletal protein CcmA (bactofilin family)
MSHLAEINSAAEQETRCVLLAFAASSGIGFYESKSGVRRIDIVTGQNELQSPGNDPSTKKLEFDLVPARLAFDSQGELISFIQREYLRDKKNVYYTILLTNRSLNDPTRLAMLKFLNDPGLRDIKITEALVPALQEIADRSLAQAAQKLAQETALTNVIECLSTELLDVISNAAEPTNSSTSDVADYYAKFIESVRLRVQAPKSVMLVESPERFAKEIGVSTIRGLEIKGEIRSQQDLFVDDRFEGAIELSAGVLTIGPNGVVQANVKAPRVIVLGKIRGDISATDTVEIRSSGSVQGDIMTPRISIWDGAYFKGAVDIVRPAAASSAFHGGKLPVETPSFEPFRSLSESLIKGFPRS